MTDKPERPTEWPATVHTPYGPQEIKTPQEYTDLERQGLVRSAPAETTVTQNAQTGERQTLHTTSSRSRGEATASDSKEN